MVKSLRSTGKLPLILAYLSVAEAGGIDGVAVKCIDIIKNIDREVSLLNYN